MTICMVCQKSYDAPFSAFDIETRLERFTYKQNPVEQSPIDCSNILPTTPVQITTLFIEERILELPLKNFFNGLSEAPQDCLPEECSLMKQDCSEPLVSDFIKMKNLTIEVS